MREKQTNTCWHGCSIFQRSLAYSAIWVKITLCESIWLKLKLNFSRKPVRHCAPVRICIHEQHVSHSLSISQVIDTNHSAFITEFLWYPGYDCRINVDSFFFLPWWDGFQFKTLTLSWKMLKGMSESMFEPVIFKLKWHVLKTGFTNNSLSMQISWR